MDRILIRFNTKFEDDKKKRTWRVLVNGKERLASSVMFTVPGATIQEPVDGVVKYHIELFGKVVWDVYDQDKAIVVDE